MASSYSFLNVVAAIAGPGAAFNLGAGASVSEEGISIAPTTEKNIMVIGADGKGQNTLVADNSGLITIRLLKTSPTNGFLQLAYDLQSANSALWGQNVITITDTARKEVTVCQACSFKKKPEITYDKAGPVIEWTFDAISINTILSVQG